MSVYTNISAFDYSGNKLCDLYDSQNHMDGQAYSITLKSPLDGLKTLTFTIPYTLRNQERNFRWQYLQSEYLIRVYRSGKSEWFVCNQPKLQKTNKSVVGVVSCTSTATLLKTKNIYKTFDDSNGIGTIDYLLEQVLAGTGWSLGYVDPQYEEDGVTEKVRTLSSGNKQGALGLITAVCNIFKCRPEYDTDQHVVNIYSLKNRTQVIELAAGRNLDSLTVSPNSKDIITRLYVEGEYGDNGYVGIDSANPTGLSYLLDFSYYKEIGILTPEHEAAIETYIDDISDVNTRIRNNGAAMIDKQDDLNAVIGQCVVAVYYSSNGFDSPIYTYGNPTSSQQAVSPGDTVVVLQNNGKFRYDVVVTTAADVVTINDYGLAKFAKKASGSLGSLEVQIEAKEKEIENLNKKINRTTKEDKINEYLSEIGQLNTEIEEIYNGTEDMTGLYELMDSVMNSTGLLYELNVLEGHQTDLSIEQNEIEATFIAAMGNLLRDGYWSNQNYVPGQEAHLYADSLEVIKHMSHPEVSFSVGYVRLGEMMDIPLEDVQINAVARLMDDDFRLHENLFVSDIEIGIDDESLGKLTVSNKDLTLQANSLSDILSRMSQLSDLIEQKNALYERARAITKNGTIYADRLNGQIDVLRNQLLSTVSNWYTDEQGNILFLAADGGSAMMLSGAGFMIASSKDENGDWEWRPFGTGSGFTADEIVAGFISAERIESGSISTAKVEADFGEKLVISNNSAITNLNTQIQLLPGQIIQEVTNYGFQKTYIQMTDPRYNLDEHGNPITIHRGDYWIVAPGEGLANNLTWGDVQQLTWQGVKDQYDWIVAPEKWSDVDQLTWQQMKDQFNWGHLVGMQTMYCWDGAKWIVVYDRSEIAEAYTRITQTEESIKLEAYRANAAEGQLRASLTVTADEIRSEVTRAQGAEAQLSSLISQTANNITLGIIPAGKVLTQGSYISIENGTITINAGGRLICTADQISLGNNNTLESVLATKGDVQNSVQEFYLSTSKTSLSGGSWVTTAPEWTSGKYMWMRTKVTHANSSVTYMPSQNGVCIAGATGTGIASIAVRYYLHTSSTTAPSAAWAEWQTSMPAYEAGKYYWTWTKTTFTDGTESNLKVSELGVNAAYDEAADAYGLAHAIYTGEPYGGYTRKAYYSYRISSTGITSDDTTLSVTSSGRLEIMSGGGLYIAASGSTTQNPKNVVVMNNSGIAIATAGELSIESDGKFKIKTGGTFTIESGNFTIDSSGNVTIEGTLTSGNWKFYNKGAIYTAGTVGTTKYTMGLGDYQGRDVTNGGLFFERTSTGYGKIYLMVNRDNGTTGGFLQFEVTGSTWSNGASTPLGAFYPSEVVSGSITLGTYTHPWFVSYQRYIQGVDGRIDIHPYAYGKSTATTINNIQATPFVMFQAAHSSGSTIQTGPTVTVAAYNADASYMGQSSQPWTYGYFSNAYLNGTALTTSSREKKHNILDLGDAGEAIDHLRPVSFAYNNDKEETKHLGLIWEEVEEWLPDVCRRDPDGDKYLAYGEIIPVLIGEIKSLRNRVRQLG